MASLWEEGVREWTPLLEKRTTPKRQTHIYILNATSINAEIHEDKTRRTIKLETTLSTIEATLLRLPASYKHRKLPKEKTSQTQAIHATWHIHIDHEYIPKTKPFNNETITTHPSISY